MVHPLSDAWLAGAVRELADRDPLLASVHRRVGVPPPWRREPGFASLLRMILEQQVSLASADAAYARLRGVVGDPTPEGVLGLDDATLRAVGFSRQKAGYARDLARAITSGVLDLDALVTMPDDAARAALTSVRGIGRWTADVYLTMALGRPDVWPVGDRALHVALHEAAPETFAEPPGAAAADAHARRWAPWRSAAARLLWADYLARRGRLFIDG